jgi:hypothetical protein
VLDPRFENPNGLLFSGRNLILSTWGTGMDPVTWATKEKGNVYRINLETMNFTKLNKKGMGNLDGLERVQSGYLASDWKAGVIYYLTFSREHFPLIPGLDGSADIGYVKSKKLLLVPEMNKSRLLAYEVNL